MSYTKTNWQDLPNTTTPITANNLNKIENELETLDTATGTLDAKIDTEVDIIDGKIGGEEYDSTATYEIGDFCIYNNKLYRCTTAISTAEAFTPAHWEETSVEEELDALRKSGGIPTNSVIGFDGSTIPSGFEETDGPNDYSTTEKVIGKWIDGKPLYRKCHRLEGTALSSGMNAISGGNDFLPDLKQVVRADIRPDYTSSGNYNPPLYNSGGSVKQMNIAYVTYLGYTIYVNEDWGSNYKYTCIFEYTKSTD